MERVSVMLAVLLLPVVSCEELLFPEDFLFGAATAAYQVEGAWNVDGKAPSIWDTYTHTHPEKIQDRSTGDEAEKSYYLYKEDVAALKSIKMNLYRFSISWPRIMPKGLPNEINQKGIDYYNNLIDELLKNGIEPMVTMYHWDLPQHLQDLGGWANGAIVDYFGDYARILYKNFGDRVKYWITINEPLSMLGGYMQTLGYSMAPDIDSPGVGTYLVAQNIIKSHARAYRIFENEFKMKYDAKISMAINWMQVYPLNPESKEDVDAADRAVEFYVGLFAHPIFTSSGDYPEIVQERVEKNSLKEGFLRSRLPCFTEQEIEDIRGTADFFALNMYSSMLATEGKSGPVPSFRMDTGITPSYKTNLPRSNTSTWLTMDPRSMYDVLLELKKRYGDWEVIITENGYSDEGRLDDEDRITYLTTYLINVLKAIHHAQVKVTAHITWSIIDNFEWSAGYVPRFGLYQVNVTDKERKRVPKKSSEVMKKIIETRLIPEEYYEKEEKLYA